MKYLFSIIFIFSSLINAEEANDVQSVVLENKIVLFFEDMDWMHEIIFEIEKIEGEFKNRINWSEVEFTKCGLKKKIILNVKFKMADAWNKLTARMQELAKVIFTQEKIEIYQV